MASRSFLAGTNVISEKVEFAPSSTLAFERACRATNPIFQLVAFYVAVFIRKCFWRISATFDNMSAKWKAISTDETVGSNALISTSRNAVAILSLGFENYTIIFYM